MLSFFVNPPWDSLRGALVLSPHNQEVTTCHDISNPLDTISITSSTPVSLSTATAAFSLPFASLLILNPASILSIRSSSPSIASNTPPFSKGDTSFHCIWLQRLALQGLAHLSWTAKTSRPSTKKLPIHCNHPLSRRVPTFRGRGHLQIISPSQIPVGPPVLDCGYPFTLSHRSSPTEFCSFSRSNIVCGFGESPTTQKPSLETAIINRRPPSITRFQRSYIPSPPPLDSPPRQSNSDQSIQ